MERLGKDGLGTISPESTQTTVSTGNFTGTSLTPVEFSFQFLHTFRRVSSTVRGRHPRYVTGWLLYRFRHPDLRRLTTTSPGRRLDPEQRETDSLRPIPDGERPRVSGETEILPIT